ncbi:LTA synthase family protein [Pedobacter sp.]|uniref:LTA synthase family protein n=1 Tax=Pedobacter sp. TaxID=1411316 RepID=UPI00396CE69F
MKVLFKSRTSLLFAYLFTFILLSFAVRVGLYLWSLPNFSFSVFSFIKIFGVGLFYDIGVALFFSLIYALYVWFIPKKLIGTLFDKICTFFIVGLTLFITIFACIAEFTFWDEFSTRFNFIAVDYLIYTYEVVENINESYPIPLIIGFLVLVIIGLILLYKKTGVLKNTFQQKTPLWLRSMMIMPLFVLASLYVFFVKNTGAEWSQNLYESELSKNGVFSFFAAFRSNELDYNTFYATLPENEAYHLLKKELIQRNEKYTSEQIDNIRREVEGTSDRKPNIVMVVIESFSADFLARFGNKQNITPNYDALTNESIFFNNIYATGTRTVRGMEALTLSVPPTPGNSIVRRPNNDNIFSIASILKQKNYDLKFVYGGDGYFDNMNTFFGGQGFDIVDRDRGNPLSDNIKTKRYPIKDEDVAFENAWGICDEDLYKQSLKFADSAYQKKQPFFQFVMTTSNHKPYTFPDGKIDLKQGERESAVKYTDYALGKFLAEAKNKPWFENTVFVVVADHCASSAGKWEINIEKHHIPALIYNLDNRKEEIGKLCSQIDLLPTLLGYLNWNYQTELYGKDVNKMAAEDERALIGNYRTLGLLKHNVFTQIDDRKNVKFFSWNNQDKSMNEIKAKVNDSLKNLTIAYYQTASERFKNGKMKQKSK